MGGSQSSSNVENITQQQLAETTQICKQDPSAKIDDAHITIIDSRVGDISLTNQLNIGNLGCTTNALTRIVAQNLVKNITQQQFNTIPLALVFTNQSAANVTNIASLQQSIIDQSCIQTPTASLEDVNVLIIDSTTGNLVIANSLNIQQVSCNLAASTYQSIANAVTDDTSQKASITCCGCDLAMLLPLVVGLLAIPVVAVVVKKMSTKQGTVTQSSGNSELDSALAIDLLTGQMPAQPMGQKGTPIMNMEKSGPKSAFMK